MSGRHEFGAALRDARNRAGWSQAELAKAVHYSPGQLSKIENGLKAASIQLARRCDTLLGTGGELERLTTPRPRSADHDHDQSFGGDWVLRLSGHGSVAWTAGPLATGNTSGYESTPRVDLEMLIGSLDATRRYATGVPPAAMIPILIGQLHATRALALAATESARKVLFTVAACIADMLSHAVQESGDHHGALQWSAYSSELANNAGDANLAAYATVRQALMMVHACAPSRAIELAAGVRADGRVAVPVRWLAAHREAEGYALAGQPQKTRAALAHAGDLEPKLVDSSLYTGATLQNLPLTALVTGWSLYDLGLVDEAARTLDEVVPAIPTVARRSRARFGARRALAHAVLGATDLACAIIWDLLDDVGRVDSATIRVDLRATARTLARWPNRSSVRDLQPHLSMALLGRAYG